MSFAERLRPLFIADFCVGLMFYWSILFPFMHQQGLTTAQLGLYAIVTSAIGLLLEIPSGILADRWSRKGVTMIGIVSLAIGAVLLSRGHDFSSFMLGTIFTSTYFALNSGMKEAMIYDTLLETDNRDDYEKQLGKLRTINTVGTISSSILGGIIAGLFNFQLPFYLSVVSCLLALLFLSRFNEPMLHKKAETAKLLKHIATLIRSLNQHYEMRLLVITSIFVGVELQFMTELDPLWPIALGLATIWYGPLNAFLMVAQGFCGPLLGLVAKRRQQVTWLCVGLLIGAAGLLIQNIFVVALSEFLLLAMASALTLLLSGRIQDELPSSQRSGVESAIGTLATLAFIGVTFLFSYVATNNSVFVAAWIVVGFALIAITGVRNSLTWPKLRHSSKE